MAASREELKKRACEAIDKNRDKIIALGESIMMEPELGYKLSQTQAGKGLGTESVRAVLELARTLEIPRVTALVRPENHPSRRLLEKTGFLLTGEREGELRYCFRL